VLKKLSSLPAVEQIGHSNVGLHQLLADTQQSLQPYLLTPWSRVLLEKLTGLQLVKKLPHIM
jgi:hypothetical protein